MKKRLARTCNLDGSEPIVFELPPPRTIANLTHHPDSTCTGRLTDYGRWLFGQVSTGEIEARVAAEREAKKQQD